MKRADALRKLRTICERLDTLESLPVTPLRLYLFGSVLTDKEKPADIDLILVHELPAGFNFEMDVQAMAQGRPTADQRAIIELRRGMQKVQVYDTRDSLRGWDQQWLLLEIRPRLLWEPGGDWTVTLADIEANPLPWAGERLETQEEFDRRVKAMPPEEVFAKVEALIADIEGR